MNLRIAGYGVLVVVAFGLGCATAATIPQASADSPGPRFEYHRISSAVGYPGIDKINAAGAQGWELVAIGQGYAYFKRPL